MSRALLVGGLLGGLLLIASAGAGCNLRCGTSADCETGEVCNLDSGECKQGCTSNANCEGTRAYCDTRSGLCRLGAVFIPTDLGVETDAASDASVADDLGASDASSPEDLGPADVEPGELGGAGPG